MLSLESTTSKFAGYVQQLYYKRAREWKMSNHWIMHKLAVYNRTTCFVQENAKSCSKTTFRRSCWGPSRKTSNFTCFSPFLRIMDGLLIYTYSEKIKIDRNRVATLFFRFSLKTWWKHGKTWEYLGKYVVLRNDSAWH